MDESSPSRRETLLGAGAVLAVAGGGGVLGHLFSSDDSGQSDDADDSGQSERTADSGQSDSTTDSGQSDDADDSGPPDDGPITACSFNILHETSNSDHPWESRRPRVTEAIGGLEPGLLGIQEAKPGQFSDLREAFPDYEWYGIGREGGEESEAVPVAWATNRFEMRETGEFWLSPTPEKPSIGWAARYPRISTWASLTDTATGTDIWFCNAHVSSASWRTRRNSAELIRQRAVERTKNGEVPVVSIDLNNEPSTPSYESITGQTDAGSSPVVDGRTAADEASVRGPEKTYHAFTNEPKERFDYVFTPKSADVHEYRTLEVREGGYRSDHLPVAATFEL
ncbi:Metal-dependent hydrolase, endonuclease/exonuclease/phosphatase family [Halopelagius inordinatus]|uniref:Metal-dependent hydrolase, endonuclease/exonuclease/phosphatase family n=1 Tax=Halopelagius inordinatus TaxID=553467 RepID=A0A1I2UX61_9EURY|nr:endonuclease/exonuclease/phosphatase family protein [Halopelagius inordinatus]SFG80417.1 Metal-dependent hydrolase, endonuclease/exonuclease/phosphatase family [Halopelagius inordinatus]